MHGTRYTPAASMLLEDAGSAMIGSKSEALLTARQDAAKA